MIKKKLLGYYDYTVILTYCGMLFAFFGVLCAIGNNYCYTMICLMIAGICDMFDGTVASTKVRNESEKKFGIQIDSLSDLVSFGVLPGIFVYMISERNIFSGVAASLFVLCALIRLAYFNVLEEERQSQTTEKRKTYLGVPVTTIAILLPALFILYDFTSTVGIICFPVLLIIVAICFILPLNIKKPQKLGKVFLILIGLSELAAMIFILLGHTVK